MPIGIRDPIELDRHRVRSQLGTRLLEEIAPMEQYDVDSQLPRNLQAGKELGLEIIVCYSIQGDALKRAWWKGSAEEGAKLTLKVKAEIGIFHFQPLFLPPHYHHVDIYVSPTTSTTTTKHLVDIADTPSPINIAGAFLLYPPNAQLNSPDRRSPTITTTSNTFSTNMCSFMTPADPLAALIGHIVLFIRSSETAGPHSTTPLFTIPPVCDEGFSVMYTDLESCDKGQRSGVKLGKLAYRHHLQAPLDRVCRGCSPATKRVSTHNNGFPSFAFTQKSQLLTDALSSPPVVSELLRSYLRHTPCAQPLARETAAVHVDNFWVALAMVLERDGDRALERWMLRWTYPVLVAAAGGVPTESKSSATASARPMVQQPAADKTLLHLAEVCAQQARIVSV
ncbi:hypothetical protein B0H17DRAFT_1337222 [Mycena rosella]|uniref:Uncharacterized protein n=1 Tax=Mycena rosella TaxID=1033263 RepID=A0AAD7CSF6_MYCRO|nr:hypothetical protein B0H17DRAFT_1337222 [Mycena rosella]